MNPIRSIQQVTGTTLTVAVPAELAGKQVEVVIQPLSADRVDARLVPYLLDKPPLTDEDHKVLEQNRYPLRGTGGELLDPFAPAVPEDDWEVYRDDPA